MDSKKENTKTAKLENTQKKYSKIKVVPLELLKATAKNNEISPTPVRHSSRIHTSNKLIARKSATQSEAPEKDKIESIPEQVSGKKSKRNNKTEPHEIKHLKVERSTTTKESRKKKNIESNRSSQVELINESEQKTKRNIKIEPRELSPPLEQRKSIMKVETSNENPDNLVKKRKRSNKTKSTDNLEDDKKRKPENDTIVKRKSVTFAKETTEILGKYENRKRESAPLVNSATTLCKTNISPSKKRKARPKTSDVMDTPCEQMYVNDILEVNMDENGDGKQLTNHTDTGDEEMVINEIQPLIKRRKRGRKPKYSSNTDDEDLLSFDEESGQDLTNISLDIDFEIDLNIDEHKKRGRKRGEKLLLDNEAPPKYYKIKDRPGRGVRCIKCNILIPDVFWLRHNFSMHNNLAWRDGDTPVNLSNREQVFRLWGQVVKSKMPLKCGRCGEKKLSAVGFYSHIKLCGKDMNEIESQKATCKLCGARMLSVSLKSHMVSLHMNKPPKEPETDTINSDNIIVDAIKRQAASKALNIFKTLNKDTEDITDMYGNNNRGTKTPKYYINMWKRQITIENSVAKCFSPNCTFQTKILDDILNHYDLCKFAPQKVFNCKQCNFESSLEPEMVSHIKSAHTKVNNNNKVVKKIDKDFEFDIELLGEINTQQTDDINEYEILKLNEKYVTSGKIQKQCYKFDFLLQSKEPTLPNFTFTGVILWARQFRQAHYSEMLFNDHLKAKWEPIEPKDIEMYLPEIKKSIHTSRILMGKQILDVRTYEHQWKTYDLFEADVVPNAVTMFCGGPVCSIAWVPMPVSLDKDQYLAVFCKPNMNSFHKVGYSYSENGLIQIWNCGNLNNNSNFQTTPHLALAIAHEFGVIWHMEWCPSGCYQESERLGLLALATSTGHAYIISVPFPSKLSTTDSKTLSIYKTKPIYQLNLQDDNSKFLGDTEMQVTKLKWSQVLGHNIIAAGYSNGMVALWNLKSTSPLLQDVQNDCIHLYPYLCFQAHSSAVTVIDIPTFNEVRWLLTASHDQLTKFWDLNDIRSPIVDYKRGITTDGFWCPHWNCAIVCCDDVLMQSLTVTSLVSCRDFSYKPVPLFRTSSPCKCLSGNEWMNGVAQGSVAGEWQLTFPNQVFFSLENEKNLRLRRLLGGYTEWIDRTKTSEELILYDEKKKQLAKKDLQEYSKLSDKDIEILPFLYEDAAEKYGVVFCDFNLQTRDTMAKEAFERIHSPDTLKEFPFDMYPIASMNKMAWNPNEQSYRYIAIGYEAGFVRLQCVQFMRNKIN